MRKSISKTNDDITASIKKLLKRDNISAYKLAKLYSNMTHEDFNKVRAKLSNYLNGKSRWPNDFIVPFTYIFGVSLKEIYGDKGKVKVLYKSEVDKNKIVDLVMDGIRERIKEIIDKNL